VFYVIVHEDVEGAGNVLRGISNWLRFVHLRPVELESEIDRYIGYWKPYATNHQELDNDLAIQKEVRNAAGTLRAAVTLVCSGFNFRVTACDTTPKVERNWWRTDPIGPDHTVLNSGRLSRPGRNAALIEAKRRKYRELQTR